MLTNATAAALSDSALLTATRAFLTHLDPEQQANRDYVLDVLMVSCKRPSLRATGITCEIFEFLA